MLKRKIATRLEQFRKDAGKYALLVDGARQVGKTFIIREFARRNYSRFIEINFLEDKGAKGIFENSASAKEALVKISAFSRSELKRGDTLVFLDEIQACPDAVTFIKFLVEEGSCHYILSGSLLGVELKNIRSVPVGYRLISRSSCQPMAKARRFLPKPARHGSRAPPSILSIMNG